MKLKIKCLPYSTEKYTRYDSTNHLLALNFPHSLEVGTYIISRNIAGRHMLIQHFNTRNDILEDVIVSRSYLFFINISP